MKNTVRKTPPPATAVISKEPQATEGSQTPSSDKAANDRLSAALKFANELNESRLCKIRISYKKRWTPLKRARQSVRIRYQKPWLRATGPKTARGKGISARNAMGGDAFDRAWLIPALQANEQFLRAAGLIATLQRNDHPVPDDLRDYALTAGKDATNRLLDCLALAMSEATWQSILPNTGPQSHPSKNVILRLDRRVHGFPDQVGG